jgi:hypothetical protein
MHPSRPLQRRVSCWSDVWYPKQEVTEIQSDFEITSGLRSVRAVVGFSYSAVNVRVGDLLGTVSGPSSQVCHLGETTSTAQPRRKENKLPNAKVQSAGLKTDQKTRAQAGAQFARLSCILWNLKSASVSSAPH